MQNYAASFALARACHPRDGVYYTTPGGGRGSRGPRNARYLIANASTMTRTTFDSAAGCGRLGATLPPASRGGKGRHSNNSIDLPRCKKREFVRIGIIG